MEEEKRTNQGFPQNSTSSKNNLSENNLKNQNAEGSVPNGRPVKTVKQPNYPRGAIMGEAKPHGNNHRLETIAEQLRDDSSSQNSSSSSESLTNDMEDDTLILNRKSSVKGEALTQNQEKRNKSESKNLEVKSSEQLNKNTDKIQAREQDLKLNETMINKPDRKHLNNNLRLQPKLSLPSPSSENGNVKFYIGDAAASATPTSPRAKFFNDSFRKPLNNCKVLQKNQVEFVTPDGGFGWVVVVAACVVNSWIVGFVKSYSLLYVKIMEAFPGSSAYHVSFIPAMLSTIGLLVAPMIGVLCRQFTSRKVSVFGGLLCFAGLFLSAFATSVNHLIITIGVITGLGSGLVQVCGLLLVSLYFDKKRAFASGVCVSGNAIGSFYMPPLVEFLLREYNLRGTLLILSALMLHIVAASLLFRPIKLHGIVQAKERLQKGFTPGLTNSEEKGSFFDRIMSSKALNEETRELNRQVSFLRSTSFLSSVPDLTQYAKSWNISHDTLVGVTENIHDAHTPRKRTCSESYKSKAVENFMASERKEEFYKKSYSGVDITGLVKKFPEPPLARQLSNKRLSSVMRSKMILLDNNVNSKNSLALSESTIQEEDERSLLDLEMLSDPQIDPVDSVSKPVTQEPDKGKLQKIIAAMASSFDMNIIKRPKMILMSISIFLISAGAPHCLFYISSFAQSQGVDGEDVSKLLSISAAIDLIARLSAGKLADANIVNQSFIYSFGGFLAGSMALGLCWTSTFPSMVTVLSLYGFGVGCWFVLIPTTLGKTHGVKNLAASYGFTRFCMGIQNFISPQISGLLVDFFGSYHSVYYFMGGSMVLGAALALLHPYLKDTPEEREAKFFQLKEDCESND